MLITLVDGVGRPKVLDLPDDPIDPITIEFAHQGITSGPERLVKFDRQREEADPAGRPVYRMRGSGLPAIRGAYLLPWKDPKFLNSPRFGSPGD